MATSGVVVTPQTAMTLTAFYSGVNVISTDVAKLPFHVYKLTRGGGRKIAKNDPRERLLCIRPNPEMNAFRYWQMAMGHALGWGNHYSRIERDDAGMPVALWPLNPGAVQPLRSPDSGTLYYRDAQTGKTYRAEDVLHIAGLSFDGITGYNPAVLGRQAVGLGIAAQDFGSSLFGNGAIPRGMVRTPKRLSEDAIKRLREDFEAVHRGTANANRIAFLEENMEWVETQISPEAAQFLATRQFQVVEIARLLNLPPHKLQDYSQSHLANVEESNLDYAQSTLTGWVEAVEAEVDMKLFFDDEQGQLFSEHDMRALMRGNSQARADYYVKLKTAGIICADTAAAAEGLPIPGPENGGDLYLIQSQNIPAQDAGKPAPKPPPPTPLPKGANAQANGDGASLQPVGAGADQADDVADLEDEQ